MWRRGTYRMTGRMERINLGKGKWLDDFLNTLKAPSPITIWKPLPSPLVLLAEARIIQGAFAPADLGVSMSINPSAGAISSSASPPWSSVESLLQFSSLPIASISPPLAAVYTDSAAAHRTRHSVDAPVFAPKDACALLCRESNPDPSSLGLGPSPGRVGLHWNSTRNEQRSGTYVPRRSSPEEGSGGSGGESDSPVPIPFPRAVSGEHGSGPSPVLHPITVSVAPVRRAWCRRLYCVPIDDR
jgi:hypothetical protein